MRDGEEEDWRRRRKLRPWGGSGVVLDACVAWVDMGVVAATFLTAEVGGTAEDGRGSLARG